MPTKSTNSALNSSLRNERGNALVLALVATVIMTLAGYFINQTSLSTESQLRRTRMKNELTVRFARVLTWMSNSSSRTANGSATWLNWNDMVPSVIQKVQHSGSACSYEAMSPSDWNQRDWILCLQVETENAEGLQAKLFMIGKDKVAMAPMNIDYSRSFRQENGVFRCDSPDGRLRVMRGFNLLTYRPICDVIQRDRTCGPNQYLRSRNADMSVVCGNLPTALQRCPSSNQYIEGYNWDGQNMNFHCSEKINPFLVWPNAN